MNTETAVGMGLVASGKIINTAANVVGIAKTGAAIGTL
jgi:hypothetical protein